MPAARRAETLTVAPGRKRQALVLRASRVPTPSMHLAVADFFTLAKSSTRTLMERLFTEPVHHSGNAKMSWPRPRNCERRNKDLNLHPCRPHTAQSQQFQHHMLDAGFCIASSRAYVAR